ncbi:hypothetical protein J7I97_16900 [Streptomyces sp. ISL-87]|uniref:hypothetical protein n=1 Tax=Streptomyces sp. ISL-87 TaxID=2819188 RepID=UPI001BED33F8|nr:hypothetical protein [Streptomyces sp. ISL-87]MBT2609906.1 hypothetical protein [Streptomyces sp. ISL-87]
MQTYVSRDAWGNSETRPIGEPITHKEQTPSSLVGRLVLVRPFYHAPSSRSGLKSVRSPFVFEAQVIETFGEDMVKLRFTWESGNTPWAETAVFYPNELHQVHVCECAACKGDGAEAHWGA